MKFTRSPRIDVSVAAGERLLASASAADGTALGGTRDAFYVAMPGQETRRVPWEGVEAAGWDRDTDTFRLTEVGTWGEEQRHIAVEIDEPGRLLELVRERVTASVVLQRHVAIDGRRGVRVIARRAPRGDQPIHWSYHYDEGIDPDDPVVRTMAKEALEAARTDVGVP